MNFNIYALITASLVPMVLGFIYYHPKMMGTVWQKATGLSDEDLKKGNMLAIFGISLLMSFLLAVQMYPLTVHQMHFYSALMNHENEMKTTGTAVYNLTEQFKPYLNEFRTFKHGALHGFLAGVFFVLPIMATNGMFERKSWRYILVNWLYWTICITIMGAIICGWQ